MPENWILINLYQYYLNKADNLKFEAKIVSDKFVVVKKLLLLNFMSIKKSFFAMSYLKNYLMNLTV